MEARAGVSGRPETPVESRPDTAGRATADCWNRVSVRLEVPADMIGRAMSDIQRMAGTFESPVTDGEYA